VKTEIFLNNKIFETSLATSRKIHCISITEVTRLILLRKVIAIRSNVFWALMTCTSECPTFRRNISPTSSVSKNKPSKKLAETGYKLITAGFLLGLLFDHEDRGIMFLQNRGMTPNYTAYITDIPFPFTAVRTSHPKSNRCLFWETCETHKYCGV
jgi:hypothetical protein